MTVPSKETGFFYMMYMRSSNNYYKCWIDGNPNCEFYTSNEILDIAKRLHNPEIITKLKESFRDSSVFVWMVDEGRIERARPDRSTSQVTDMLRKALRPETPLTTGINIDWRTTL